MATSAFEPLALEHHTDHSDSNVGFIQHDDLLDIIPIDSVDSRSLMNLLLTPKWVPENRFEGFRFELQGEVRTLVATL